MSATCKACQGRLAAEGSNFCLACNALGHGKAPEAPVNQSDPRAKCDLLRTSERGLLLCVHCNAPVKIVNLFGGSGFYQCTTCGKRSDQAVESKWRPAFDAKM